jgi:hypothetical protein
MFITAKMAKVESKLRAKQIYPGQQRETAMDTNSRFQAQGAHTHRFYQGRKVPLKEFDSPHSFSHHDQQELHIGRNIIIAGTVGFSTLLLRLACLE